jgi:sulfite exporter TauE/SafE
MELALIFMTGMLLSLHCVGMCGGFVALLAVRPLGQAPSSTLGISGWSRTEILWQQLVFNGGRVATYTLLGAIAGGLGSFSLLISRTGRLQAILMITAGAVMAISGLALAGLLKHWSMFKAKTASPQPWLARWFAITMHLPRALRALPLGALLGFLPCGLIYTMLGKAASTGSAREGALTMFAFGFGTVPALLLVAFFADLFTTSLREKMVRLSGLLLLLLGAVTVFRGILWLHSSDHISHMSHNHNLRNLY